MRFTRAFCVARPARWPDNRDTRRSPSTQEFNNASQGLLGGLITETRNVGTDFAVSQGLLGGLITETLGRASSYSPTGARSQGLLGGLITETRSPTPVPAARYRDEVETYTTTQVGTSFLRSFSITSTSTFTGPMYTSSGRSCCIDHPRLAGVGTFDPDRQYLVM